MLFIVSVLTAPCTIGRLMYSRPAARTVAGSSNGRSSIGSRLSTTTSPPAALNDLICCSVGWPPVIHPDTGSAALGRPATAERNADTMEATLRQIQLA